LAGFVLTLTIEADVLKEADRIITTAANDGITLRLLGGTAIGFRCPSAKRPAVSRKYPDIDLVGYKKQGRQVRALFEKKLGYSPHETFNALRGASRLMYFDLPNKRRVDIFLDIFDMCHKIDLRDRLTLDPLTLTMADLLATKLQIFKTNEKDFKDITAMLLDHPVSDHDDHDSINGKRIAALCASDWGIYKTFSIVLDNTAAMLDKFELAQNDKQLVKQRMDQIRQMIETEPKGMNWKMRAKVGEKVKWYMLPDDMAD